MIASFAMGFEMIGLESSSIVLTPMLTWSLSGLVLGLSAIASIVFPQTYGAGSAAASVFILGFFGFDQTQALGFAGIWWIISQVPAVILGLPSCGYLERKVSAGNRYGSLTSCRVVAFLQDFLHVAPTGHVRSICITLWSVLVFWRMLFGPLFQFLWQTIPPL